MIHQLEEFYLNREPKLKECLLLIRDVILSSDEHVTEHWKYKTAYFHFNGKGLCYLHFDKKSGIPYVGFIRGNMLNHHMLLGEGRKVVKVLPIPFTDQENIENLLVLLRQAILLY